MKKILYVSLLFQLVFFEMYAQNNNLAYLNKPGNRTGTSSTQAPRQSPQEMAEAKAKQVTSVTANTLLVSNTNNSGSGSFRQAVLDAVSGDTIRFDNNIDGDTIKLTDSQILLDKNLVIIGNDTSNTIIDGMSNSRIFEITAGDTVSIDGIKMQNGRNLTSGGGAIFNAGVLAVQNCSIVWNKSYNGGGVTNSGHIQFVNCSISNNESLGGADGGGGVYNNGFCVFKKCQITRNLGTGIFAGGGGVLNVGEVDFIECLIAENSCSSSGLVITNGGGVVSTELANFIRCEIKGNSSPFNGGGIYLSGVGIFISSTISGNFAQSRGGGIAAVSSATLNLKNCNISGNKANIQAGGVFKQSGSTYYTNTIIAKNSAPADSDFFGSYTSYNNLIGTDPLFVLDVPTAPSTGGDLHLQACSPAINTGTPDTTGLNLGLQDLDGNPRIFGGTIDMGAYEFQNFVPDPLTVSNTNDDGCGSLRYVIANASPGDTIRFDPVINGDTIKLTTGQILIDKNLTIIGNGKDSTILDGQAMSRLFEVALNTTLNLDSVCIQNGDISSSGGTAGQGGAIFVSGRLDVSNSLFQGNKAQIGGVFMAPANGTANIFIDNCTFRNNQSTIQGGVIGFGSDTLSIQSSTFSSNVSSDDAGVIRSISAEKVLLTSSTFSSNTASSSTGLGGVMRDNSSSVEVNSCTFYNNSAQQGGAFYLETNNFSITNSILKNTASGTGQDINIPGGYTLTDLGHNMVFSTDGSHGITDGNGVDPKLLPLADNGGTTQTHALRCDSPSIDAGTGTMEDQRGFAVFNGLKDIGAFESQEIYDPLLVTNTQDDSCGSLRFIVANAVSGDTIRFSSTIDGDTIKLTTGQITLDKKLVIIGNDTSNTIIDGMNTSRIFHIPAGDTVTIDGIKLQGGNGLSPVQPVASKISGGAILNEGTLTLTNSTLSGNNASNNGGGMFNSGMVTLTNSTLSENTVNKNNSAISGTGGGMYNSGGTVTLTNCTLNGNLATKGLVAMGGGIYNVDGTVTLTNCMLSGNSSYTGGGIYNVDGSVSLTNSILRDNIVSQNGGGITNDGGTLTLSNSTLSSNSANYGGGILNQSGTVTLINSTLSANTAFAGGGMFNSGGGIITLTNSILSGNSASTGGGIGNDGISTVTLANSTLSGNTASGKGGGISNYGTLTLTNSIVAKNMDDGSGPDIFRDSGTLTDGGHNLIGNTTSVANLFPLSTLKGGAGVNALDPLFVLDVPNGLSTGGDLHLQACSPAINMGTADTTGLNLGLVDIEGNARVFEGIIDIGAYEYQSKRPLLVTNTLDNGCGSLRNVVAIASSGDTIRFDHAIDGDTIKLTSGHILLDKNLVVIGNDSTNTIIDGMANENIFRITSGASVSLKGIKMQNGRGLLYLLSIKGGAIFNQGFLKIAECQLTNNEAQDGGALHNLEGVITIENSIFSGNIASLNAGGLYNYLGVIDFTNSMISDNVAGTFGGGVVNIGGKLNFNNCIISGNSLSGSPSYGGAVFSSHSSPVSPDECHFTNCIISGNSSLSSGGGLSFSHQTLSDIINCTITGNTSGNGGGVHIYTLSGDDIDVNITNSIVSKNTAPNDPEISGPFNGSNNLIGTDPLFGMDVPTAPSTGGDLHLQACSPAINMGTADTTGLNLGLLDIEGNPRVQGERIDIGAYETGVFELPVLVHSPSEYNDIFGCENELTTIGLDISNASAYTIQWQVSTGAAFSDLTENAPYSQVTSDSLQIYPTSLTLDGYQYRALISNGCETVISDTFNLKVGATPIITLQPVSQIVCPQNEAILEVDVNGTGIAFQWQIDLGSGFVNVSGPEYYGANSNKLIISNFDYAKSGKAFRCKVYTSCFELFSDPATITINTDVTILAQPTAQTVCEFSTAQFIAQAVKLSPGSLNYQWQRKAGTGLWVNMNTGGRYVANDSLLLINNAPASWNGAEFRCLINDYCQTISKILYVTPVAHVTQNPVNQEICVGNNAYFSISAAGVGLSYRWQVNSGTGFVNLTDGGIYQGTTSPNLSLNFPSAAVNNYQYRCVVSGTSTCDMVADTSAIATISIGVSAEAQTVFYYSPITSDDGVTQAVAYILGINDVIAPNGKAEYRAGNAIILNPGFEVQAGAVFKAKIQNPCQNTSTNNLGGGSNIPKEKVK